MPGAVFLEGDKINLRTIEEEDLEIIRDIYNHPEVRKYLSGDTPANLDQERDFYENGVSNQKTTDLAIAKEGEFIGMISLTPLEDSQETTEIGLWLDPEHHGNGYGTEAAKLLIDYAFNQLNYHKIFANTFSHNKASQKLWEKLDFKREGEHREEFFKNGKHRDVYRYGLLKREWKE